MTEITLNKRVDLLEVKVSNLERKLKHANLDPQQCFDQFKILKDNSVVMQEMVKSTLDYLEGLGSYLKYKPSTLTAEELGYGKKESIKGDKKDV